MKWTDQLSHRVKLRDLHVLIAVAHAGSISRAAERLAISHPVVSRTISDLEHTLGVRLFDRSSRGVEPTMYGRAFLDCGISIFDELRLGVQRLESLSDPYSGEVRIGSYDAMMASFIPAVIDRLARKHPNMVFHTIQGNNRSLYAELRERKVDLIITRKVQATAEWDLATEDLFPDPLFVVTGPRNRWISRRKINLSELINEPWIMPVPESAIEMLIGQSFQSCGLEMPRSTVTSNSIPLRNRLLASGRYLAVMPRSILHFGAQETRVTILPVTLPRISQSVELVTLKNRTLSPATALFIESAREIAKSVATSSNSTVRGKIARGPDRALNPTGIGR
jgi:DNA-binding transcriptional LysR family regulator